RLDGYKDRGRWQVHYGALERYLDRKRRADAAGGWCTWHAQVKRRHKDFMAGRLDGDVEPRTPQPPAEPEIEYEYWISAKEAAATLQITDVHLTTLAARHGLTTDFRLLRIYGRPRVGGPPPRRQRAYL